MASYIGCPGLILIVLFIVFLFLRRKKLTNELTEFYRKNQFYTVNEFPASIFQALGKGNWQCLKGSLVIDHKPFEFYWLESFKSSSMMVNGTMQSSITPFLAIVFPPNSVSEDFMRKAWQSIKSKSAVKDFFVLNTDQPIRIEKLSDGCFLMMWQVLYKVNIYEQKLKWLETNLS